MIGSGAWASYYGRSLQKVDDIDLVAVAGGSRAPKYAETFGIRLYQAIPDLLADDQIDLLFNLPMRQVIQKLQEYHLEQYQRMLRRPIVVGAVAVSD